MIIKKILLVVTIFLIGCTPACVSTSPVVNSKPIQETGFHTYLIIWNSDDPRIEEIFQTRWQAERYVDDFKDNHDYKIVVLPNVL